MKTNKNSSFFGRPGRLVFILSAFIVATLHLSMKVADKHGDDRTESAPVTSLPAPSTSRISATLYDSLSLSSLGMSREAFDYAVAGYEKLRAAGKLRNESILTVADFSLPSTQKRLFVIDVDNNQVLFHTYVAHGRNSGGEMAQSFSNTMSSFKSSPGFYVTGDTYIGGNGYSLRLHGQEKGINDRALERAIVMHGADYVSAATIKSLGYLGRSYGCPAVSHAEARPIINRIKAGTCLFIYSPSVSYVKHSKMLGVLI